jgi:hypothetical protein
MRFGNFVPNSAGIMEIWRSGGMQSALRELATAKESEAEAIGRTHGGGEQGFPPDYKSGVAVLSRTAVGYVTTGPSAGKPNGAQVDHYYHKTLDAINH